MTAKSKLISELQQDVLKIYRAYEKTGTNKWTYQTALIDLQYQIGSLAKCALQLRGDRFNEGKTASQLNAAMGDELADILAEALFIAHELGIDLSEAWENMLQSDKSKIATRTLRDALRHRQAS